MKGILERDYLCYKDGHWYRLKVTRREKYEAGSQDCSECAFFRQDSHGPSCAIEFDGFLTCCDVGRATTPYGCSAPSPWKAGLPPARYATCWTGS